MGGCFGNSAYDRSMENQLFRHLEEEDANDCENCQYYKLKYNGQKYKKICQPCIDGEYQQNFKEKKEVKK